MTNPRFQNMNSVPVKAKASFDENSRKTCKKMDGETFERQTASTKHYMAWRYYTAILGFLAGCVMNLQRMALAVAVVNMANFTSTTLEWRNRNLTSCPVIHNSTHDPSRPQTGGEFDWSPELQGLILGVGFLGYALTPMVGGSLTETFGAKRMIFFGNSLSAFGMLFSPIASIWNTYALVAVQLVRGISQGFIFPAIFLMMANWAPRRERGFLSALIYAGLYTGCTAGGAMAGFVCETNYLGWRATLYLAGAIGIIFSLLFAATFYETPRDHPYISKAELNYIIGDQENKKNQKRPPTPWFKMLTSIKTHAVLWGMFGQYWSGAYFVSVHPMYLGNVLHYPIAENGLISSLPFILMIVGTISASSMSDWLYRKKYVGVDKLRKGCNSLGSLGFSLSMAGVYLADCNTVLNAVFFAIALLSSGISTPGACITAVDMTPNFAATLVGILGTICNLTGLIIPLITGYLTKNQTLEEWQVVFLLNIAVVMSCGTVFAIFGSADVQPWNFAEDPAGEKSYSEVNESSEEKNSLPKISTNPSESNASYSTEAF